MEQKPDGQASLELLKSIKIDRYLMDELASRGSIDPEMRINSLRWLHPGYLWARWAMVMLMAFGAGLVLTGITFFFAFNWASIPDLAKLALIETGIVLAAFGAWLLPTTSLPGRLLLLAAAVLTGVFLAVFGQIYQTGADAWQLFAVWALLISIWTVIGRFLPLWVLWLGLINLSFFLWWSNGVNVQEDYKSLMYLTHVMVNGAIMLAREWLVPREGEGLGVPDAFSWLAPQWTRWLLLAAMLVFLFPTLMIWIANWETASLMVAFCALFAAVITVTLFIAFRYWRPDIPALAMVLLMICILAVIAVAIFMFDNLFESLGTTFFTAISAIVCFAAAAGYLRRLLALGIDQEELGA
nr:DUF2157 domain-containing protein [uncultured Cohaesibacter sp.]